MTYSLNSSKSPAPSATTTAYLRVSQVTQDLEKDKLSILALANELRLGNVFFIEEKISGKVSWKQRKISGIVESANQGDNLIVAEISRLGRSLLEIVEILSICSRKGVNVFSVKGSWRLDGTIQSKIIGTVFALCSEIERSLISQRTKEALRVKRINGVVLGRPKGIGKSKLDQYRVEIEALLANGSSQKFIANRYGSTEANFSLWMVKHKIKKSKPVRNDIIKATI